MVSVSIAAVCYYTHIDGIQQKVSKMTTVLAAGGRYTIPYDSSQGLPDGLFITLWIIVLIVGLRVAWEFRDKIFKK